MYQLSRQRLMGLDGGITSDEYRLRAVEGFILLSSEVTPEDLEKGYFERTRIVQNPNAGRRLIGGDGREGNLKKKKAKTNIHSETSIVPISYGFVLSQGLNNTVRKMDISSPTLDGLCKAYEDHMIPLYEDQNKLIDKYIQNYISGGTSLSSLSDLPRDTPEEELRDHFDKRLLSKVYLNGVNESQSCDEEGVHQVRNVSPEEMAQVYNYMMTINGKAFGNYVRAIV